MSDAQSPDEPQDVAMTVRGAAYTLRLSNRAWAALVKLWEVHNIQEAQAKLTKLGNDVPLETIVDVFWASLQRHHPDVTREAADDLADDMGMQKLASVMGSLIRGSTPTAAAGAKKNQKGQTKSR